MLIYLHQRDTKPLEPNAPFRIEQKMQRMINCFMSSTPRLKNLLLRGHEIYQQTGRKFGEAITYRIQEMKTLALLKSSFSISSSTTEHF